MSVMGRLVERGGMVYASGISPQPAGDAGAQTREVLAYIDGLLGLAGTSKAKLLTAQVRLADASLRESYEAAWRDWAGAEARPVRVFQHGELSPAGTVVETSSRPPDRTACTPPAFGRFASATS
jgi:enamine deaminase RidA (YjgF/YER057c/UK114 family)